MDKELIINVTPTVIDIALIEDGKLSGISNQKTSSTFMVGDIFVAKIRKLMPGLNAAFLDIGHRKDAFLHYTDLGPQLRSVVAWTTGVSNGSINTSKLDNFKFEEEIVKNGKIDQVINKRNPILVQILKEPISTKGPRLSCEITLPGRYMVLVPFYEANDITVSKKISNSEERKRLAKLCESIKPKNFGIIIRTAAEGKKVQDLHEELLQLMAKWEEIFNTLKNTKGPDKILSEVDKPESMLRDLLTTSFNRIEVNDKDMYLGIKSYLQSIAPDQVNILNHYTGKKPIFDQFGVTKQIKSSFGRTATMNSGAYLVIEKTEAMHIIDVNSGNNVTIGDTEQAILAVNLESAKEISRQLKLRDIGGLIVVDFIDMRSADNRKELYKQMQEFMKDDRAQHTVLPLSKFGLMQITRERVRPEINIDTSELCPSCNGTGKVNPTILITDDIERDMDFILQSHPKSKLSIQVHPYIEAFLKKGFYNKQMQWYMKYNRWIKIQSNADMQITSYRFVDSNDDEIRLN